MVKYQDEVLTVHGDIVPGASITVYLAGTSSLATLYANTAGTVALANPVTADYLGAFSFYAQAGTYDLVITGTGITQIIKTDVPVGAVLNQTSNGTQDVRYVSTLGHDSNDGRTILNPMKTVCAAIKSLTRFNGNANNGRYYGTVYIGPGTFIETDTPLPVNESIQLIGTAPSSSGTGGTIIKLANGRNTDLIAYEGTFTDWAHGVIFKDITFDGNVANNAGAFDVIKIYRPGYHTSMWNTHIKNAPRYGLNIVDGSLNFYGYNMVFDHCTTAAIKLNNNFTGIYHAAFWGTQIDACGTVPILISGENSGNGTITFDGIKAESTLVGVGSHQYLIKYDATAGTGVNLIRVSNVMVQGDSATVDSVVYESAIAGGTAPRFVLENINMFSGYTNSFKSDRFTQTIATTLGGEMVQDLYIRANFGSSAIAKINMASSTVCQIDKIFQTNSGIAVASTGTTIKQIRKFTSLAVDPGSIAATSRGSIAVSVPGSPGIVVGDVIIPIQGVNGINDDLVFEGVTATGANQVTFFFYNPTGGAIDDGSVNWDILWMDVT